MNERKLKKLFEAAWHEPLPAPSAGFAARVLQAIRRDQAAGSGPKTASIFDQLNLLFPRLAWAAVALIALCVAVNFVSPAADLPSLTDGVAQVSDQWLFTADGL